MIYSYNLEYRFYPEYSLTSWLECVKRSRDLFQLSRYNLFGPATLANIAYVGSSVQGLTGGQRKSKLPLNLTKQGLCLVNANSLVTRSRCVDELHGAFGCRVRSPGQAQPDHGLVMRSLYTVQYVLGPAWGTRSRGPPSVAVNCPPVYGTIYGS